LARGSAVLLAPLYLLFTNFQWIAVGFVVQGLFAGGGMQGQMVPYMRSYLSWEAFVQPGRLIGPWESWIGKRVM
jgi:hypothetical protein